VAEPDQRMAAEVRDLERDLSRGQLARKPLAEDVGGRERRRVLDGREQPFEVEPPRRVVVLNRESLCQ
jgi:hypothetical protein